MRLAEVDRSGVPLSCLFALAGRVMKMWSSGYLDGRRYYASGMESDWNFLWGFTLVFVFILLNLRNSDAGGMVGIPLRVDSLQRVDFVAS